MAGTNSTVDEHRGRSSQLEEGIALAKAGDRAVAKEILRRIIHISPDTEEAWLWLAWVTEDAEESLRYLNEAKILLPDSERIDEALRWASRDQHDRADSEREGAAETTASEREPEPSRGLRMVLPRRLKSLAAGLRRAERPVEPSDAREAETPESVGFEDEGGDSPSSPSGPAYAVAEEPPLRAEQAQAASDEAYAVADERLDAGSTGDEEAASPPEWKLLSEGMERVASTLSSISLPTVNWQRMQGLVKALASALAIVALVAIVGLGISNARSDTPVVQAWTLPTPLVDATATPTIKQLTQPLWAEVEAASTNKEWERAVILLEQIRELEPRNREAWKRLAEACYYRGLGLIEENQLEEARIALDAAIRLDAGNEDLQRMRRQLKLYVDSVSAYWAQEWRQVIEPLKKVYKMDPDFRDTRSMLAQAYFQWGIQRQADEVWDESYEAYEDALRIDPDMTEAEERRKAVLDILIPPNRIEVDLSDQIITVYENKRVKWTFICCTGRYKSPTVPGRYKVLEKLPMAYASRWDLDMPWWLGIYWAGGSQNGFHALPILSSGRTLWSGALGSPCSYGCIVLDTPDAVALYEWAEVGTVVLIKR